MGNVSSEAFMFFSTTECPTNRCYRRGWRHHQTVLGAPAMTTLALMAVTATQDTA